MHFLGQICIKSGRPIPGDNNDNDNDEFNKRRTNAIKSYRKKEQ